MNKQITIITPSHNRAQTLPALYRSLLNQSNHSFEWLIVDDGSTDSTKHLIEKFIDKNRLKIRYIYQENRGKHVALNTGIKTINSDITFIVDSDDVLSTDAVDTILDDWKTVDENDLCGISYLRGYDENTAIGDGFPVDGEVDTFINMRFNRNINGDKAEVWRTDLLKQTPFPYFEGEKFFGESYVWISIAEKYKMLHRNKIIYITEYLNGGLTKSGRALRIKCPKGGMLNAKKGMSSEFSLKSRLKQALLYTTYSFFDNQSILKTILKSENVVLSTTIMPIGYILYKYWKKKYGE